MKRFFFLLSILVLGGCSTINTHIDQLRSLENQVICPDIPITFPELAVSSECFGISDYLTSCGGLILASDTLSLDLIQKNTNISFDVQPDGLHFNAEFSYVFDDRSSIPLSGSCFPISDDGYFLTAYHVIQNRKIFVHYILSDEARTYPVVGEAKLVFFDEFLDVALVKTAFRTPRFVPHASRSIVVDEQVFGGGWIHKKGSGFCLDVEKVSEGYGISNGGFYYVSSSIPLIYGDSGSPIINNRGEWFGVSTAVVRGKFVKQSPRANAICISPGFIERIIEKDRAGISSSCEATFVEISPIKIERNKGDR